MVNALTKKTSRNKTKLAMRLSLLALTICPVASGKIVSSGENVDCLTRALFTDALNT